jgi:protein TonB
MFSQYVYSSSVDIARRLGFTLASFGLHGVGVAVVLLLPVLFSDIRLQKSNGEMVSMLSYAPRPGSPQRIRAEPNSLHVAHSEIVTLSTGSVNKIQRSLPETPVVPVDLLVIAPLAPMPSLDFGHFGGCGCVPRYLPDRKAPSADAARKRRSHGEEPVLRVKVEPQYPEFARRFGIHGSVVIHAVIDRTGAVRNISVVSGPSILSSAAVEAIRKWRYYPYILDGIAIDTEATITVNFTLVG